MKRIRDSSAEEYAKDFWAHELRKGNQPKDSNDLSASIPEYKRPSPSNGYVGIWELQTKDEVLGLRIHVYMLRDEWMTRKGLVNLAGENPTRLEHVAQTAVARGYFISPANAGDIQLKYYQQWKNRGSYQGQKQGSLGMIATADANLTDAEMPLIEHVNGSLEIVDGWGRLLPVAALLLEGIQFSTISVYLAQPKKASDATPEAFS